MEGAPDITELIRIIARRDRVAAEALVAESPALVTASLSRRDECLLPDCLVQVYKGDTALHAAAFSYDAELARQFLSRGADIRARNRRGAEPLHAATIGGPGLETWSPDDQRAVIVFLIRAGADPNAAASGGVTPLHRAVRNRCSAAVEALLGGGADPRLPNGSGSTAHDLATWTTGRGGSGSAEARVEQQRILDLLESSSR